MKIKFHLYKFEKALYFQLLHIDQSIYNKMYFDTDSHIAISSSYDWGNTFTCYRNGANFGGIIGRTHKDTLMLSFTTVNAITALNCRSNEERDIWYGKIIEAIGKAVSENLWK